MVNKLDLKKLTLIFICSTIFALVVFKSSFSDHYLDTECEVGFRTYLSIDELYTLPSKFSPTVSTYSPRSYRITKIKDDFIYLESAYVKGWVHKSNYGLKQECEEEHEKNNSKKIYENSKILVNYDHKDLWSINSNYKNSIFKHELETDSFLKNDENNFYRNSIDEVYLLLTDPSVDRSLNFFLLGRAIISQKRSITQQEINGVFTQIKDEISINKNYSSNIASFVERGFKVNYRRIELEFGHLSKIFERSDLNLDDKQHCIVVSVNDTPRYNLNNTGKFHLMFLSCFDNYMERLEIKNFIKSIYFKNFLFPDHYYIFNNKKTSTEEPNILKVQKNQSITEPNILYCQNPNTKRVYETTLLNCVGVDKKIPKGVYEKFYASKDSNISNTTSLSDLASANNSNITYCQNSSGTGVYKSQSSCLYSDKEISKRMFDKFINSIKYVYCRSNKSNVTTRYSNLHRKDCPVGSSKTTKVAWINYKDQIDNKKQTPNIDLIFDISEVKIVNASPLNVREAPNGQWLSILSEGEKVAILEKNNDNSWSKIVSEDGQIGWVSSKYLVDDLSNIEDNNKNPKVVKQNKEIIQKQEPEIIVSKNTFDEIEPSISCLENEIFTKEKTALIDCKISDNDEIFKVFIEGNEVNFRADRIQEEFPVIVGKSELEIQVFDRSGNETKEFVSVEREFSFVSQVKQFDPLRPGLINAPINKNRIAIIIGIKDYKDIPDTKYADKDAFTFIDYANETLGINNSNIKYFINDDAGFFDFKTIDKWLSTKINKNTEVFFFYSGHGANNNGQSLLLPSDFRTDLIDDTSITKVSFLQQIVDQNPKHIFAFFDACFSGLSREGETLIAGLRNISIVDEEVPFSNITIFNSASDAEFSSDFDEVGHGLFSYYLMKGLEGEADANNDQQISTTELHEYIYTNVSRQSLNLGPEQNPSLISNDDQIIVKW